VRARASRGDIGWPHRIDGQTNAVAFFFL